MGEIIVMTPVGRRGGRGKLSLALELEQWAKIDGRGEADGPTHRLEFARRVDIEP